MVDVENHGRQHGAQYMTYAQTSLSRHQTNYRFADGVSFLVVYFCRLFGRKSTTQSREAR